ncbi:CapA family protein [Bradyrhizobium sp. TZ2]
MVLSRVARGPGSSHVPTPGKLELRRSLIEDLRSRVVDVLVVSHHWGRCRPVDLSEHRRILAESQATLVLIILGHHRHFVRGFEVRRRPIALSWVGQVRMPHGQSSRRTLRRKGQIRLMFAQPGRS